METMRCAGNVPPYLEGTVQARLCSSIVRAIARCPSGLAESRRSLDCTCRSDVLFRSLLRSELRRKIEDGCKVVIDGSNSKTIDYDIIEVVRDFEEQARYRNVEVEVKGLTHRMSKDYFKEFIKAVKNPD